MHKISIWIGCMFIMLSIISCQHDVDLNKGQAVYYWRTDFRLDSIEKTFLSNYHINKIYCRYFDVVMDDQDNEPKPNATITFSDSIPDDIEIVPTIYITEDCMHQKHENLAERIVKRIRQMNETNDIKQVHEIQIDCDYTSKSRNIYYDFLSEVKRIWKKTLSTTIRLHQLSMKSPSVDYGVLMLYNTGDPRNWQERNPVLDFRDVYPYLKHLDKYPLPLAAAYPVFQWVRDIQGIRVEHTVEAQEILRVKKAVEGENPKLKNAIITYHLDKDNINRYKPETYEEIYHH